MSKDINKPKNCTQIITWQDHEAAVEWTRRDGGWRGQFSNLGETVLGDPAISIASNGVAL